ncbi:MAG TPA: histidine kinase [Burkholderiaceae bacterium]|nr:histidine kinase [Burkholderiaceae bacterium]
MSTVISKIIATWNQIALGGGRAARVVARWAADLTWTRLLLVCILALVAQSILTDYVLNLRSDANVDVTIPSRTHRGVAHQEEPDEGAVVRIGPNGVTITENGERKSAVPATSEGTAPDSSKGANAPAAGAPTAKNSGAATNARSSSDHLDVDIRGDRSETQNGQATHRRSLGSSLKEFVEGLVLLLIVYLVAAKIVLRVTAKSDARAAQAEAAAEREALSRQLAQAQLKALQAQIEPHFLFNTLASVDYLIETDPKRASEMQRHLIQYLRAALPQMRGNESWLGREVDLARAYLEILKVRMEERLRFAVDVPDGLRSAEFPPMMLQSLVENAIRHGVEPKPEGGELRVKAAVVDGQLEVAVADSGVGLTASGGSASTNVGGLGLANIRERLARLYPGRASFELRQLQPGGVEAKIRVPYHVAQSEWSTESAAIAERGSLAT